MRQLIASMLLACTLLAIPLTTATASAGWFPYGQCTYWAAKERPDIGSVVNGNAWQWAQSAAAAGIVVSSSPRVGDVVVFQPWVQNAWGAGHVGYVVRVSSGGWFQLSEMNFPQWGVVTYRWAHAGWGVSFIE